MRCDLIEDRPVASVACSGSATGEGGLKEILVCPFGVVESRNGTFILDEAGADEIVAAFDAHGSALPIDWEHQTLQGEYAAPNGRAPAAGWLERLWAAPPLGLKALVRWTDEGRAAIRADTYRFLSPVVQVRKADGHMVGLHSAALTNLPAIPRMERLAASTRKNTETKAMAERPEDDVTPDQKIGRIQELLKKKGMDLPDKMSRDAILDVIIAFLEGKELDSEASEDSEDSEVAASVRSMLGLPRNAGRSEVVLAMRTSGGSANQELAAMRSAESDRVARELVEPHIRANKINPHDAVAMSAALDLARSNPKALDRMMKHVVSIVPPGRTTPPSKRQMLIANAARDYKADPAMQKSCGMDAALNLALRDAGMESMSEDETRDYVAL